MNRLFVANKPSGICSNHFLSVLKHKYKEKKAGFSGTLDPFASGVLVIAFGSYAKLFNYLQKEPKVYEACIWLGASSKSADNENIENIENIAEFDENLIKNAILSLQGDITYTPPKFSAKHINGVRAYELARKNVDFELKQEQMRVFNATFLHYMHPFLSLRLSVSAGSYIRSWALLLAEKLGCRATLSALTRIQEGKFIFQDEKALNPLEFLKIKENEYLKDDIDFMLGKKLQKNDFKFKENGEYFIKFNDFFSIIEIRSDEVKYKINGVKYADFN